MARLNHYSLLLIGMYVLAYIVMQYGASNNWTEGLNALPVIILVVFWSEKMTNYLNHEKNRSAKIIFSRDIFIINYSFLLAIITSLILQINNIDAKGWWPFIVIVGEIYAIIAGLIFGVVALLLNNPHDRYTDGFAAALFFGYLLLGLLPAYFNVKFVGQINIFIIFLIVLFVFHIVMCFVHQLRKYI